MVVVHCGLKQKDIINLIEGYELKGKKVFKLLKKNGIELIFDSILEDDRESCDLIASIIKGYEFGKVLFINIAPFQEGKIKWF